MESQDNPGQAGRARARGRSRARSVPVQTQEDVHQPGAAQQAEIFGAERGTEGLGEGSTRRLSSGSSENGSGSKGHGNGTDGKNGSGGDIGSKGSSSESSRGGSPRGMSSRPPPEDLAKDRNIDFVLSRPFEFDKKGIEPHKTLPAPRIITNYFEFQTHPDFQMRLYNVRVEPQQDDVRNVRRLVSAQRERLGSYMLTGFMLFVTRPIRDELLVFQSTLRDQPENPYVVTLEYVRDVSQSEVTVFQFYNTLVRQTQLMLEYKLLGRHFFNPDGRQQFPTWRLELWPGFQNSIRQQEGGLMMNVEGVWKVLQTTTVFQIIQNIRRQNPQNFRELCRNEIEGMIVVTQYGNNNRGTRAYKISRIDFEANCNSTFDTKDGPISYLNYYRTKYNQEIREPAQPMIVSEPKIRDIRRGQTGDIYLVPELCYPCGLTDELRANFRLMKDLAVCLHQPPGERVQQMNDFVKNIRKNENIKVTLRNWGIKVKQDPVEFNARFLNSEEIIMGENKRVTPDDKADWTNAFRTKKMLANMRLNNWVILVGNRDKAGVGNLVQTMKRVATPLGYMISEPKIYTVDIRDYSKTVNTAIAEAKGKLDLVFSILPSDNLDNYAAVKKRCSVEQGIPSQCFLAKNLSSKGLMSICTKMVIQMNAKQGGEPWGVANRLKNAIVLGYDVHHAGPASGGSSISAMCAAVSPSLGKYYSCVMKTPSAREEVATTVASMFEKCLKAYQEKNRVLPDRIFMYRDGVGEGQLLDVFELEIKAFKDRISSIYGKQSVPKLTYIVVNKRINTRFFQKMPNGDVKNPMPGLVVDDVVTRPERYDFFLVSQTARQGCVSPTYYNVLLDENGSPPDKLQMYTYKLCHMYYNWSGTVSVPSPCQNAHKLAFQVGTAMKRPAHTNLDYLLHFL